MTRPPSRALLAALSAAGALAAPVAACAFDRFEIQVYEADLNAPGELGLEVHGNFTGAGARRPAFTGEIPPWHTGRLTFEPAVGVTGWLELGAYLQTFVAPGAGLQYGGVKFRAKLRAPPFLGERFFLGLNVEIGRVPSTVEAEGWANEFRPFLGYDDGWLLVDVNPIFGYALSGPDKFRVGFEPAAKVAVNTQRGFSLGVEWYADLGFVDAIQPLREQGHYVFGVLDLVPPRGQPSSRWELNLGVGAGLGRGVDQQVVVKTIVGTHF